MKHDIEITIDENGDVDLHVAGIRGKGCLSIIGDITRALGKGKAPPTPTAEMTQTTTTQKAGR